MAAATSSSPELKRKREDSPNGSARDAEFTPSSPQFRNAVDRTNSVFVTGINIYESEEMDHDHSPSGDEPSEYLPLYNRSGLSTNYGYDSEVAFGRTMSGNFASVYNVFDARTHLSMRAENFDSDLEDASDAETSWKPSFHDSESGEIAFDVKYTEDRVQVPTALQLKPFVLEGAASSGMRGSAVLQNKTGLNLTFFVKPSSPLIQVKQSVCWILPHEKFKVHFKTFAQYREISQEFILIYVVPLFFPEQMEMNKLREFWEGLGSNLIPLEQVECHKISSILLSPECVGQLSILDWSRVPRPWSRSPGVVQSDPCIELREFPDYSDFWNIKDYDLEVLAACQGREEKRAWKRDLQQKLAERNVQWSQLLRTGIVLILATAIVVKYFTGFAHAPPGLETVKLLETLEVPNPSLEAILIPESLSDENVVTADIPGVDPDATYTGSCFVLPKDPNLVPYLFGRCIHGKVLSSIWGFIENKGNCFGLSENTFNAPLQFARCIVPDFVGMYHSILGTNSDN